MQAYQFIDADQDVAGVELVEEREQGPVLWLQTSPSGCYIPVDRLAEFIEGLKNVAAERAAASA